MLKENLRNVESQIQASCEKSGRQREDVTLIAVSKTKPVELLQEAYDAGVRDFGENKVQEICDKYDRLPSDIRWHMIGHLQRNKVKHIIDKVCMIHSVDSYRLAEEINIHAKKHKLVMPVLIEVNIAQEQTKFGVSKDDAMQLIEEAAHLDSIQIQGLMAVAPYVENAEENRKYFRELAKLAVDIRAKNIDNVVMRVLSMGMTGDYAVAIEEGAAMVRVGTGIFGERDYRKKNS
ncbi:MAG: YggS family pyridoxal phosphate-dependent enzyme [Eubacterium sp.]|jgi:pyridoxal phosphate enzyme (YggS family)|nr:YggS family pyridoxal phosphate-dependent enzyme [Eubacterium sp.]